MLVEFREGRTIRMWLVKSWKRNKERENDMQVWQHVMHISIIEVVTPNHPGSNQGRGKNAWVGDKLIYAESGCLSWQQCRTVSRLNRLQMWRQVGSWITNVRRQAPATVASEFQEILLESQACNKAHAMWQPLRAGWVIQFGTWEWAT